MAQIDDLLDTALRGLPTKPDGSAPRERKQGYSQQMSACLALAFADELRDRGLKETLPSAAGVVGRSGAERRLAGGIGAKKVDVTWATEESGLLLSMSIKTINFRDRGTKTFQKNLVNRRGDMLGEALTLHRRFPYAVVAGFLFLDRDARTDDTPRRRSTFENAFPRLRLFTGRQDPAGRDEQFERLYLVVVDANPSAPMYECFHVIEAKKVVQVSDALDEVVQLLAERNFDFYEAVGGRIKRVRS